ncbi:nicotinate-nucleotide adenylyltransferase [Zavarzinia aquatilis]|uniref:Probable nicotinate-nucleotide adenylyltransferase n=1 Tax=Zavarzinia aquatilis TaxID=2211142 RepID=A0A317EDE8_9PROT|nr:nicotinate-nucleotide adenylyltransferase [Zavarzinia aquatilis]PWR24170.1 nicotinic acid mononucleotide adenylyltransferase [Zavarzinia aquatilis]
MSLGRLKIAGEARGLAIGLFGGSFNPAHDGHRDLSLAALRHLGLDRVWWLVSPQNPLKSAADMAPLAARLASAGAIARHPRVLVTDIETRLGTVYTAQTIRALRKRFPRARFVWLMGADNLATIHRWRDWRRIFGDVAVAVFDRPTYSLAALGGPAAHRFAAVRRGGNARRHLKYDRPPAWAFVTMKLNPASATALRAAARAADL